MAQMNNLTRKRGQPLQSQQLMMQRVLPIIFAYFYMVIPAAVVLYMIISTGIRIITQDIMFRTGVSNPNKGKAVAVAGAAAIEGDSEVIERPAIKAAPPAPKPAPKPTQKPAPKSNTNNRMNQGKPLPRPNQPRAKAKRKRKAR
jgi:membrane protein insertase Oxa1/YidC/SpoIIIJ